MTTAIRTGYCPTNAELDAVSRAVRKLASSYGRGHGPATEDDLYQTGMEATHKASAAKPVTRRYARFTIADIDFTCPRRLRTMLTGSLAPSLVKHDPSPSELTGAKSSSTRTRMTTGRTWTSTWIPRPNSCS